MPRPYDQTLFEDLHRAWTQGESLRSLARRTPYHRETLTHALRAYGLPPPPPTVSALDATAAWLLDRVLRRTAQHRLYVLGDPDTENHPWTDRPRQGRRRRARARGR